MTYAELSEAQARRSRQFAEAQTEAMSVYCDAERDLKDLQAENEKLRELVSWMYDRMDESCAVQYPYAPTPISYDRLMQAQARACELGIEVDDGAE